MKKLKKIEKLIDKISKTKCYNLNCSQHCRQVDRDKKIGYRDKLLLSDNIYPIIMEIKELLHEIEHEQKRK